MGLYFCQAFKWLNNLNQSGSIVLTGIFLLSLLHTKTNQKWNKGISSAIYSRHISRFLFSNHLTGLHWEHWGGQRDQVGLAIQITNSHENQNLVRCLRSLNTSLKHASPGSQLVTPLLLSITIYSLWFGHTGFGEVRWVNRAWIHTLVIFKLKNPFCDSSRPKQKHRRGEKKQTTECAETGFKWKRRRD